MTEVGGEAIGETAHGTRRFPDAARSTPRPSSACPPPSANSSWAAAALLAAGGRGPGRERRLDRLRQERRRLAVDVRRLAPVPRDRDRRLQRRLAGRRRHDDRASTACACTGSTATGSVLADFDTPVSDTRPAPAKTFYGPFDPAISPDGKKVAYTYYYMTQSQSPTCFPPDVRDHDQRGRYRLLVGRPPDRLGRPGARQALRLAQPVVGRQRHRDDQRPHAHAATTT